jgi:hypothetical protein
MKHGTTKRTTDGAAAMRAFRAKWHHGPCWICHTCHRRMHPHHIVFRRSKRHDDARNLAAVCCECHDRIHGATIVRDGLRLQPIPLAEVLRVKRLRDGENFDLAFLRELSGKRNYGEE